MKHIWKFGSCLMHVGLYIGTNRYDLLEHFLGSALNNSPADSMHGQD